MLDYYRAINDRDYAAAYNLWADDGKASGQTLDQFTQGFTQTMQVEVQLGAVNPAPAPSDQIEVPVDLAAVVNDPSVTIGQKVQRFTGTYTVRVANGSSAIAKASINESPGGDSAPAPFNDPVTLIRSYYDAINSGRFAAAFTHWESNGRSSQQSFADFQAGFANTRRVQVQLGEPQEGGAAGSSYTTIPIVIAATNTDGSQQTFCGNYVVRRANVPPFDQLGWHIYSAQIVPTTDQVALNSDQAQQLLGGGCPVPSS